MWRHSSAVLQRSSRAWETTSSFDETASRARLRVRVRVAMVADDFVEAKGALW